MDDWQLLAPRKMKLLDIHNLRAGFTTGLLAGGRGIPAVAGVSLTVDSGDTLGLVGESGCGKTTLARCAMGLIEPQDGSIHFEGRDLRALPPAELRALRRKFQMIFQDPFASLDPRMTVQQILSEPLELHRLEAGSRRKARLQELLAQVALDNGILDRRPGDLSGGQQQRIAIARALALRPRLLIADEPVSALDASVQAQILNLLADLKKRFGLTLILISHSLAVVQYLCTRVAVMYLGRIVEEAPAEDFFKAPRHPYSRALLESMPAMNADTRAPRKILPGDVPSPADPPPGCPFHPRCSEAIARCRTERPELQGNEASKVACWVA